MTLGCPWPIFWQSQILLPVHLNRENLQSLLMGKSLQLISSPEPSGSQGELIVYPYSGVRCHRRRHQQCLNIFSSETTLTIKAKFYVEPPWEGGTKVYISGPGHMTKMAAMPIYSKNLQKSSSPEPEVLWSWNLARSIGDSSSTKFI